ncbi:hypothetical protein COCNU_11G005100 [Cocos nucifera]|uniref:Uncharacterized protein n=1 Tax=Cocos nucifera TaxID=13894 RepID=A0A8K0N9B8_COCNU|nr:hypothetical protein COCNU_11G005100 [Cocos nucifera]
MVVASSGLILKTKMMDIDLANVEMMHSFLFVKKALAKHDQAKASLEERLKKEVKERKLAKAASKKAEEDHNQFKADLKEA